MSGINLGGVDTPVRPVRQITRTWNFTWPKWWHWHPLMMMFGAILLTIAFIYRPDMSPELYETMLTQNVKIFGIALVVHGFLKGLYFVFTHID